MSRYLIKPDINTHGLNSEALLPFNLTLKDLADTIDDTHEFLHLLNTFLVEKGYLRLEEILLGNSFAGLLSEILVKTLSDHSMELTRNTKVGGYPDLIPEDRYPDNSVLRGTGVEIKASKQNSGFQGHNPEPGWIMIFRYSVDTKTEPMEERAPTEIVEVMCAELIESDWTFSGRSEKSRRTITASINRYGMAKLRENKIYSK